MNLGENTLKFLAYSIEELTKKNVSVKLIGKPHLCRDGSRYGGQFCSEEKVLEVAVGIGCKRWFPVYIHEFCHFLQSESQTLPWLRCDDKAMDEVFDYVSDGLKKPSISNCKKVMSMEKEADKKALGIIKDWRLEVDAEMYTKQANAYLFYYSTIIREYGVWPEVSLYKDDKFLSLMPGDKIMPIDWFFKAPEKIYKLIKRKLKKKTL